MGIRRRSRIFPHRPRLRQRQQLPHLIQSFSWKPPTISLSARSVSASPSGPSCFANSSLAQSCIPSPAAGPGAGGWLSQLGSTMNLGHGYVDFCRIERSSIPSAFLRHGSRHHPGSASRQVWPWRKIRVFPAHNIVYVVTGTFILLFGWMGFNPGSTLAATDLRISVVAVNTNLAAVARLCGRNVGAVVHDVRQARHHHGLAAMECSPDWWPSPRPVLLSRPLLRSSSE